MKKLIKYRLFKVDNTSAYPGIIPFDREPRNSAEEVQAQLDAYAKAFKDVRSEEFIILPVISFEE